MSSWGLVGKSYLKPDWQFFPATDKEIIKISQSYSYIPIGYFLIGQFFSLSPPLSYGVFSIYPTKTEDQLKILRIPEELKPTERWIGVKLPVSTLLYELDWLVTLETLN